MLKGMKLKTRGVQRGEEEVNTEDAEKTLQIIHLRVLRALLPSALKIPQGLTILQVVGIAALSLAIVLITRKP